MSAAGRILGLMLAPVGAAILIGWLWPPLQGWLQTHASHRRPRVKKGSL
jgi:hypothetical protein